MSNFYFYHPQVFITNQICTILSSKKAKIEHGYWRYTCGDDETAKKLFSFFLFCHVMPAKVSHFTYLFIYLRCQIFVRRAVHSQPITIFTRVPERVLDRLQSQKHKIPIIKRHDKQKTEKETSNSVLNGSQPFIFVDSISVLIWRVKFQAAKGWCCWTISGECIIVVRK